MSELDIVPFRRLLDRIVVAARCHWREIALPIAAPLIACGALFTLIQIEWLESLSAGDEQFVFELMAMVLVVSLMALVLYTMAFWVLTVGSVRAIHGEPMELWQAWRLILQPRVFVTLLGAAIIGFASLLFCLVPALYVLPMLSFVVPVITREEKVGFEALRRSRELASFNPTGLLRHNCWLQLIVLTGIGTMINYALALSIQMPFVVVQQVIAVREIIDSGSAANVDGMATQQVWLQLAANMLGGVVTAVAWMYWTFGIALLYEETVRRKEAPDLVQAVGSIVGEAG